MATYDNGDQVRVTGNFTTAGTLADPTGDAAGIRWDGCYSCGDKKFNRCLLC